MTPERADNCRACHGRRPTRSEAAGSYEQNDGSEEAGGQGVHRGVPQEFDAATRNSTDTRTPYAGSRGLGSRRLQHGAVKSERVDRRPRRYRGESLAVVLTQLRGGELGDQLDGRGGGDAPRSDAATVVCEPKFTP
jgi:hypothetical protein